MDAATFSDDGLLLFASGYAGPVGNEEKALVAVDALTGDLLASDTLADTLAAMGIAHDATRGLLFVGVVSDSTLLVEVREAATLSVLGILPAPQVCLYGRRYAEWLAGLLAANP